MSDLLFCRRGLRPPTPIAKAKSAEPSPEQALAERQRQRDAAGPFWQRALQLLQEGHSWNDMLAIVERDHPEVYRAFIGEDAETTEKRNYIAIRKHVPEEGPMTMLTELLKSATADERAAAVIFKQIETVGAEIGKRDRTLTKEQAIALACRQRPDLVHAHDEAGDASVGEVREREQTIAKRRASGGFERTDKAFAAAIDTVQQRASAAGAAIDHRTAERRARTQYAEIYGALLHEMGLA